MPIDVSTSQDLLEKELQLAISRHQAGEFQEAGQHYLAVLQADPHHGDANYNMGIMAMQMKQPAASLPYFAAALDVDPSCGQYWLSYIEALFQSGQMDDARQLLILARNQGLQGAEVDALTAKLEAGVENVDSMDSAPPAVQKRTHKGKTPGNREINALMTLFSAGRLKEAEKQARLMTVHYPTYGLGWKLLGASIENSVQALAPMQKAAALLPNDFEVHYNLSLILYELGRLDEACTSYRRVIQVNPAYAPAYNNLGVTLQEMGKFDEAETSFRQAIEVDPNYTNALHNLGLVLQVLNRLAEAEEIHRRTLQLDPEHAAAHCNLGIVLLNAGNNDAAAKSFRRALQIKPNFLVAHNNLIFCLDMADNTSLAELQHERDKWAEAHATPLWQETTHANNCDPNRRLRIGYISADLREHSAAKVFGGVLTQYDRSQFDVIAYSNFNGKDDRYTELFKNNVTVWRSIVAVPDESVVQMIRDDNIDILVDLSGHTAGNRLLVFARKPAPIQITALGYAAGTGMRAMDVFLTDAVMVPPQEQHYYREKVKYLPCALSLFSMDPFPPLNALPALTAPTITFGTFNRLAKSSEETYRTWARILQAIPESRLLLKTKELNDDATRSLVLEKFTRAGIAPERIIMQGGTTWYEHMQAYHQIDIALDPFPHGGGVTALEGLMMGVPLITHRFPSLTGRVSASVMTTLGMTDWIAETKEQYVEIAIQKTRDLQSLAALRQQLRDRLNSSVMGNQTLFVRAVEQQYRTLWQEWCLSDCSQD